MYYPIHLFQIPFALVVLYCSAITAEGECSVECSCAPLPPMCLPGVSWVTDQCGCCKICARQFNEDCSASEPCDHIKGLRCHLGARGDPKRGLCRAEAHGLPCEFNGRLYQHSENFQPSCQHQCICMDGVVGCMSLCPHQVPLPNWRCSQPRLARPESDCCDVWVCDDENNISEEPDKLTHTSLPNSEPHSNHISALLLARPKPQHPAATREATFKERLFTVSGDLLESSCFLQTTEWTACSATCGMAISSRVTNDNPDCRLIRETRLCQIRECDLLLTIPCKGKRCQRTVRPQGLEKISFAGCSTAQRYRPRTCGTCTDGRCCTPSLSRTVRLRFHCPDGESFYRNVMWIQRCSCSTSCHTHSSPSVSLHNDIHTFRH